MIFTLNNAFISLILKEILFSFTYVAYSLFIIIIFLFIFVEKAVKLDLIIHEVFKILTRVKYGESCVFILFGSFDKYVMSTLDNHNL